MFGRRKEELQIMNRTLEELGNSQKNIEVLLNAITETNANKDKEHAEEIALLRESVSQLKLSQNNTENLIREIGKISDGFQDGFKEQGKQYRQDVENISNISKQEHETSQKIIEEMSEANRKNGELLQTSYHNTEKILSDMKEIISTAQNKNSEHLSEISSISLKGQELNNQLVDGLLKANANNEEYINAISDLRQNVYNSDNTREVMKDVILQLEGSQRNTEALVKTIESYVKNSIKQMEEPEITEQDKQRAALALNLCAVSISQIIDYEDINILDQEYEIILNNLNLEYMPKDEALLSIIKQILDTITFFRIQEKEKEFVEKQYQMNLKNAIWKAIPNPSVIVAGGSLPTMGVALATQIGIGFMNYRSEKAKANDEKEKQNWILQKAAIEQLNGLRRELFDASWRMADKYDYKEEYRLTENQIYQYNQILMDSNSIRKYNRLKAIEKYFKAYPSFLYFYGHAALEVAYNNQDNNVVFNEYVKKARGHFDKYINKYRENKKLQLLRNDTVASSCALEYIDLLDSESDKGKICELIDFALSNSGNECDIKQFCAIDYLKIGEIDKAVGELEYLVNEGFNTVTNSQLLSTIYVHKYIETKKADIKAEYDLLAEHIIKKPGILFPWPQTKDITNNKEEISKLQDSFIAQQRVILKDIYSIVMLEYVEKSSIEFNKCLPAPNESKRYPDVFYSDHAERVESRRKEYLSAFSSNSSSFGERIMQSQFALKYIDTLNGFLSGIKEMLSDSIPEKGSIIYKMAGAIEKRIADNADMLNELPGRINSQSCTATHVEQLLKMSFKFFVEDSLRILSDGIGNHIWQVSKLEDISVEENTLYLFCQNNHIRIPNILSETREEKDDNENYFEADILGGEAFEQSQNIKLSHKMCQMLENEKNTIINYHSNDDKALIYCRFSKVTNNDFINEMKKLFYYSGSSNTDIYAILLDKRFFKPSIVFSTDGLIVNHLLDNIFEKSQVISYENIQLCDNGTALLIGDYYFDSKSINMIHLNELFSKYIELNKQKSDKKTNRKYIPKYQDEPLLEIKQQEDK